MADGVWRCATDGTTPTFVATRPPTRADLEGVIVRVAKRVAAGIERAGERVGATDAALDGCRRAAVSRGTYGVVDAQGDPGTGEASDEGRFGRRPLKAQVAVIDGFNLHASMIVRAQDFDSRERLVRYVARPTVALDRVSELPDGRVAWKLKIPGGRGETHRIMDPMEFMARLSALVPPPRYSLVRYHGVFAPNPPWRAVIVPATPPERTCALGESASAPAANGADVCRVDPEREAAPVRTKGGDRIDWATLMHRVWGWDGLKCPTCEGRMRFIAVIQARDVIERILTHLGLPSAPVVFAPARRWDDTN